MKILFYNHTGQVSGAERVLLMILAGIDSRRFDSVVACPAEGRLLQMMKELRVRTVSVVSLTARFTWRLGRLIQYLRSFVEVIRSARAVVVCEAPDVVHANSIRAGLVMSAATIGLSVPIVWHAHDLLPRHLLSTVIRLYACMSRRNRIVAVSQAVADRFRGTLLGWFRRRVPIDVIHNAVDLQRFQPNTESRQELRSMLGIAETQLLLGTVGQLTPRKGQLELIEAFAELANEFPEAVLLVVGEAIFNRDQEYAECLLETAKSLGLADRIQFLGAREDVPVLMRAFDLLIVNSRAEPFGLTVVEAMASGTPVVANAVDGINEIIHHGQSGWLVEGRDSALVEGMRALLCDQSLRHRLGREGRLEVIARFSTKRFLREVEDVYRGVANGGEMPQPDQSARKLEVKLSP